MAGFYAHNWPNKLFQNRCFGEVFDAKFFWVLPRDFGGPEKDIPKEKQIAVIAFVMGDAI